MVLIGTDSRWKESATTLREVILKSDSFKPTIKIHFEDELYFPLAEEQKEWKMFSHTTLGSGPRGLTSHVGCFFPACQCWLNFRAKVPTQPSNDLRSSRYQLDIHHRFCIQSVFHSMLGCVWLWNKIISCQWSAWQQLPELCGKNTQTSH